MCGAFGTDESLRPKLSEALGVDLQAIARERIRPSETMQALCLGESGLQLIQGAWGIQPSWSKSLLINARLDSLEHKPTFKCSYQNHRCAIPLSWWFDNQKDPETRKIIGRYRFVPRHASFVLMAGIYYPEDDNRIVSITTDPTEQIRPYKDRMPYVISSSAQLKRWLHGADLKLGSRGDYAIEPV